MPPAVLEEAEGQGGGFEVTVSQQSNLTDPEGNKTAHVESVEENEEAPARVVTSGEESEIRRSKRITSSLRFRLKVPVTACSAPFDLSYHPGILKFYEPPMQRQKWGDTQILPRVNWGDLFFDLFYVAAAYNVSWKHH